MIKRILKLADKLDKKGFTSLAQQLELDIFGEDRDLLPKPIRQHIRDRNIMHRKTRSPISRQNLMHYFHALNNMLSSDVESTRKYAEEKLIEYDPVFRKFAPELFDIEIENLD